MTLRSQINMLIAALMAIFAASMIFLETDAAREGIREEIDVANRITVQLLGTVLHDAMSSGQAVTPYLLVNFMERVGRVRAHDIKLYNDQGQLVYTSPNSSAKGGESVPAWFSGLVTPQFAPVSMEFPGGRMLITPDASRSVTDAWNGLQKVILLTLGFLVFVNGVMFLIVGRALSPLRALVRGLEQMERFEYHARLPSWATREMALLGNSFNRMAQTLEESSRLKKAVAHTTQELQEIREVSALIQTHVEEERRNLARELHDELGQSVTAVRTIAASIANQCHGSQPEMASRACAIMELSGQMYDDMHRMVRQLRPLALDNLGLADALTDLASTFAALYPRFKLDMVLPDGMDPLPEFIRITAYRIVQECLNNAVKHSEAENIQVHITMTRNATASSLRIVVVDDGRGALLDALSPNRFGLLGMRERVQGLGGQFGLASVPGRGFRMEATIPVEATP